jgi:outer membrane biosynthesis protein TonB
MFSRKYKVLITIICLSVALGACGNNNTDSSDNQNYENTQVEVAAIDTKADADEEVIISDENEPEGENETIEDTKKEEIKPVEKPAVKPEVKPVEKPKDEEKKEMVVVEEPIEVVEKEEVEEEVDIEEGVSFSDKAKALSLVMEKLTLDQIQDLRGMASGGFTADEKAKALSLLKENFSPEEQEWIWDMYEKYK